MEFWSPDPQGAGCPRFRSAGFRFAQWWRNGGMPETCHPCRDGNRVGACFPVVAGPTSQWLPYHRLQAFKPPA